MARTISISVVAAAMLAAPALAAEAGDGSFGVQPSLGLPGPGFNPTNQIENSGSSAVQTPGYAQNPAFGTSGSLNLNNTTNFNNPPNGNSLPGGNGIQPGYPNSFTPVNPPIPSALAPPQTR